MHLFYFFPQYSNCLIACFSWSVINYPLNTQYCKFDAYHLCCRCYIHSFDVFIWIYIILFKCFFGYFSTIRYFSCVFFIILLTLWRKLTQNNDRKKKSLQILSERKRSESDPCASLINFIDLVCMFGASVWCYSLTRTPNCRRCLLFPCKNVCMYCKLYFVDVR